MRTFLSGLLIAFFVSNVQAQEVRVMTFSDVLQEARINNPDLVSAKEQVNQAKAERAIVRGNALPQINSTLNFAKSKSSGHKNVDAYDYGVTVKQLIFDGLKTSNEMKAATQNTIAFNYNDAVISSNVRLNLRVAFIDLINEQESLRVSQEIAVSRKRSMEMINLQYQGGREHKGSLMTAQANLTQAENDVMAAKRGIALSQRRLVKAMGWKTFMPIQAKGELSQVVSDPQEPLYEQMIENVPLLKQLVAKKEAAKYHMGSARSDFFPAVYANAAIGKTDATWPPHATDMSAGVSVTFPIFLGGTQQGQLDQSRAAYAQAQADERSGRDGVLFTLAQTWTLWQNSNDDVVSGKKFLEAALEREKIAQVQYSSGLISFNDWIIIEDSLVSAKKNFLSAQSNALVAFANWEQAKGVTIDE